MKNFSRLATILIVSASFSVPFLASAQFDYTCNPPCPASQFCNSDNTCVSNSVLTQQSSGGVNLSLLQGYKTSIVNIINDILVPVLFAIAFITFFWGAFKYFIWGAENEMEKAEGRKFAMWGIIGFVIILSIWGLVNLVTSTLALPNNNPPNTPRL